MKQSQWSRVFEGCRDSVKIETTYLGKACMCVLFTCVCIRAWELVSVYKQSLWLLCYCYDYHLVCLGVGGVSDGGMWASSMCTVCGCLWTSLQRHARQLLSLSCTPGHDCYQRWSSLTNTNRSIKWRNKEEMWFIWICNPNKCIPTEQCVKFSYCHAMYTSLKNIGHGSVQQ